MFEQERSFEYFDYQKLYKDFCYKKPFVFSYSTQTSSTKCEFEEQILFKNNKCVLEDKVRVQRSLGENGKLRITSAMNSFRLNYTHRLLQTKTPVQGQVALEKQKAIQQQEQIKAYTTTYTDRKLQNSSVQFGVQRSTQKTYINANITSFFYTHKNEYLLYSKILYLTEKFKMGLLSIFDVGSRNLQTNDLVFEFKPSANHQLFLRGQVDGLRNYSLNYKSPRGYFDFLACNYIIKVTESLTMMAELKYNLENNRLQKIESLIEKTSNDRKFRFCLNHFGDIMMQIGVPLSLGSNSRFNFGLLVSDIMKSRKISYGFKLCINS